MNDRVVRLWNTSTLQPIKQSGGDNAFKLMSQQGLTSVAFSTNGATVLTASTDKWIHTFTLGTAPHSVVIPSHPL